MVYNQIVSLIPILKTIGMTGGISWKFSIEYYRIISETVREKLGGLHSAKSIMYSALSE
jgi:aspartate racemase